MISRRLVKVCRELEVIKKTRRKLLELKRKIMRRQLVQCGWCKRKSNVSRWIFVQGRECIVLPSDNCGGLWVSSDTKSCYLQCPRCETKNFIYVMPEKEKIFQIAEDEYWFLEELFAKVIVFKNNMEAKTKAG